ncbi:hypothetical protein HID58_069345 [Brassica napus]|uniref:Uncharacterized protein n=1 Tax=Brassica napus TaxID=3708 RepID=A0ABQ7YVR4_BRANA|nr:hypothetical protein HID58_069345 [Brassica napus]
MDFFRTTYRFPRRQGDLQFRVPINGNVAAACSPSGWMLPSPRSDESLDLHVFVPAFSVQVSLMILTRTFGLL